MPTNVPIDPDRLETAYRVSGLKAAVAQALEEYVARRRQAQIVDLFGKLQLSPEFDNKAARSRS